ncbi:PIN domain-containing protein [Alkalinema sp. FACHB-956]|uniref:PIN domain-containing protein n=1 Tax=Alkalinema sp. FACHB-956 TaxID=2692768 RepID=UPI00321FDFB0
MALEINQTRDAERKSQLRAFADLATLQVTVDESIEVRAGVFIQQGVGTFDALHLACAEIGCATALLTTDDRMIRWAGRHSNMLQVKVVNPVRWLLEVMTDANP